MTNLWERPPPSGEEYFGGLDRQVKDFWRWALSDLVSNANRGILAQFFVASAVGDETLYDPWATVDVYDGDLRIQVKAGGRLQGWEHTELSTPSWVGNLCSKHWHRERAKRTTAYEPNADVWVFAVQTCEDALAYDPLDLGQWEFYVLSAATPMLRSRVEHELKWRAEGKKLDRFTIHLWQVKELTTPVTYANLAAAIRRAEQSE